MNWTPQLSLLCCQYSVNLKQYYKLESVIRVLEVLQQAGKQFKSKSVTETLRYLDTEAGNERLSTDKITEELEKHEPLSTRKITEELEKHDRRFSREVSTSQSAGETGQPKSLSNSSSKFREHLSSYLVNFETVIAIVILAFRALCWLQWARFYATQRTAKYITSNLVTYFQSMRLWWSWCDEKSSMDLISWELLCHFR